MNPKLETHQDTTAFDAALTRALERAPDAAIPADFAARITAALPAPRPARTPLRVGRTTAAVAAVTLIIAIFALAPHVTPALNNIALYVELLLLAQLTAVAWWLSTPQASNL